ncbi:putative necrosis-inducing factor-domain-containing protein [Cercophora samala]|uniref:Necrosis-inducing factor-domain-containing protein n=1 Tax=Cercophora samala TaxID=330535 RepID=A0AA39ZKZ5_9PEZI|nr:putative necrosis-inducing factor-domain-containing protein [Cercophora samala]
MHLIANLQAALALTAFLHGTIHCAPAPAEAIAPLSSEPTTTTVEPLLTPVIINLDQGEDPNPDEKVFKIYTGQNTTYYPPSSDQGTSPSNNLNKRSSWCKQGTHQSSAKTSSSPWRSDCTKLYNNIVGNGRWTLWGVGWHNLASYGTCRYRARAYIEFDYVFVGNEDVRAGIQVQAFLNVLRAPTDRMAGRGSMTCGGITETEYEILRA